MMENRWKERYDAVLARGRAWLAQWAFLKKPFVWLAVIYVVAISALLRADFNYVDDMGRAYAGYKNWGITYSRYLSDFLSGILHGGNYLYDISPWPQLVAVVLLCLTSLLAICLITGKRSVSLWEIAAVLPLGLSPYFLECLSYKYDAPYMAISVLAGVLPLVFWREGKGRDVWVFFAASLLGTLAVCTTYQAATGVFPMLVILLAFQRWNRGENWKQCARFCLIAAGAFCAGILIFQFGIMGIHESDYAAGSLPPLEQLLPLTLEHLGIYFDYLTTDLKSSWLALILVIQVLFVVGNVCSSKRRKLPALGVAVLAMALMELLCFGLYPALAQPLYSPRAMYGFGVFVAFLAVSAVSRPFALPVKLASLALSYCFFVFALTYGNALSVQKEYTAFRIQSVIETVNHLEVFQSDEEKIVQIGGSIGLAPPLRNAPQSYNILSRLVPVTFQGPWKWGSYGFRYYYAIPHIDTETPADLYGMDLPLLSDTMYYSIYGDDRYVLIYLK